MTDRIVCWFSCGAASAVATKLAISDNAGKLPLVVARCIVREEHPDNDRFADDCEAWFGVPITSLMNEAYDGSIHAVIEKRKYVSGVGGAPCTGLLKKQVREEFQRPTDRHVYGYCAEEQDRWDHFLDANNINAVAPLTEKDFYAFVDYKSILLDTSGFVQPIILGPENIKIVNQQPEKIQYVVRK
jgi:hypothetical protein